MIKLFP